MGGPRGVGCNADCGRGRCGGNLERHGSAQGLAGQPAQDLPGRGLDLARHSETQQHIRRSVLEGSPRAGQGCAKQIVDSPFLSPAQGERDEPVCRFVEGFITGVVAATFDLPLESVTVVESACYVCGAADCLFDVEVKS